jgi:outer membrane receptor for ferrienterochelin and colicin
MRPVHGAAAALAAVLFPAAAAALEDTASELALFDLDEQLKAETSVASARARSIRETPGIVTVLSRREIVESGARDLQDVLQRVPGFQLGASTWGVVDMGFRGIWGSEGKVLLLVDGLEMNELLYGTNQLGNHYPVDQIASVEVIRGPGSAMYGGFAELAVVNVTTRSAADLAGVAVSGTWGEAAGGYARRLATAGFGRVAGDASFSALATLGQGGRSGATYVAPSGASYDMAGQSRLDPAQVNLAGSWKGLSLRLIHDDYRTTTRDGNGEPVDTAVPERFRSTFADARWDWKPTPSVTVTPRLTWKRQTPWQSVDPTRTDSFYDVSAERWQGRLTAAADLAPGLNLLAGGEARLERAWLNQPAVGPEVQAFFADGSDHATYSNVAAFAELGWDSPLADVLLGGRVERHSAFGGSFVPRVALTRLFAPFHAKVLYAGAFRAPAIENLKSNPAVKPERVHVVEAELGWQLTDHAYASLNAFDMTIDGPIVYLVDPSLGAGSDVYQNFARTGSRGVEAELRVGVPRANARMQWSFYTSRGKNEVPLYAVPGRDDVLLGFAAHKATISGSLSVLDDLTLAPSILFLSDRRAYRSSAPDGTPVLGTLGAAAWVDLFATWRNAGARGLDLGAGVHDLLGVGFSYPQPYDNGHAPLPGQGREVLVRLSYETR